MTIKPLPLKWLLLLSLNLTLGISFIFLHPQTKHEPKYFKEIQAQLTSLQQAVKDPVKKIEISEINQNFNRLNTLISELKNKDEGQLNQLVIDSRTQLTHKLDAMHTVINSLDKKQHSIKYLTVNALPFKVISIDSIQQVSVASVTYDYKTIPLEKSDALAGWTVLAIDYGKQKIELENSNKEHVIVTLEGVEQHA